MYVILYNGIVWECRNREVYWRYFRHSFLFESMVIASFATSWINLRLKIVEIGQYVHHLYLFWRAANDTECIMKTKIDLDAEVLKIYKYMFVFDFVDERIK